MSAFFRPFAKKTQLTFLHLPSVTAGVIIVLSYYIWLWVLQIQTQLQSREGHADFASYLVVVTIQKEKIQTGMYTIKSIRKKNVYIPKVNLSVCLEFLYNFSTRELSVFTHWLYIQKSII